MFSKLKNLSEDVAKSLTDLNSPSPLPRLRPPHASFEDLKNLNEALHAPTPDPSTMSQPEDELPSESPPGSAEAPRSPEPVDLNDLPSAIRSKMKKFAKYEEKYPVLLEAYKAEKVKSSLISVFEKVLLEHTPVLSISEASMLVEYISGLNEKTSMLNNELRHLTTRNNVVKRANDDLIRKNDSLQLSIDALEKKLKSYENTSNGIDDKSEAKENELISTSAEDPKPEEDHKLTSEKLERALAEVEKLKLKAQETASTGGDNRVIHELEENLKNVTAECVELKSAIRKADTILADEKNSYSQRTQELQGLLDSTKEEQKSIASELEDARLKMKIATEKVVSSEKEAAEKASLVEELKQSVSSKEKDLATKNESLFELESTIAKLNETVTEQVSKIENLTKELSGARELQKSLKEQLDAKEKELSEKISTLTSEIERLVSSNSGYDESVLAEKEREISTLAEKISAIENDLAKATASIAEKDIEISKLEHKISQFASAPSESAAPKNKKGKKGKGNGQAGINSQPEPHQPEIERLESTCRTLEQEVSRANAEKESLQSKLLLAEEKKDNLGTLNTELLTKVKALKEDLSNQVEEVEDLRNQLKDLGSDLVDAREALKSHKELKPENDIELENLRLEATSLKEEKHKLEKKLQAAETQLDELKSKVSDLNTKLDEKSRQILDETKRNEEDSLKLKSEIEKLHTKVEDLKASEANLIAEKTKLIAANEKSEQSILTTEKNLKNLTDERDRLLARVTELSEFKSNDASLKLELASLKTSLGYKDQQITQGKFDMNELTKEKKELLGDISKLNQEIGGLKKLNKTLLNEKSALMTDQEISKESKKSLETALSKLQAERQKLVTDLEAVTSKYDELKNEKTFSANEVQSYKQQFEEHSIKYKEAATRIESLEDDLAEARNMSLERSREAATIRRLLQEAEEQLRLKDSENAEELIKSTEARKNAETQFQATLRKKQREVDELRSIADKYVQRLQDAEKAGQTMKEQYEALQASTKLLGAAVNTEDKSAEIEKTISSLRESLQETNRKVKEYQNLNSVLKKLNDECNLKFDRVSKNYKLLTQQYYEMTSRSLDKSSQEPVATPKKEDGLETSIAYLKNVLLGFMAHKEQREQLLPVIKQLFKLSADDEKVLIASLK